MDTRGLTRRDFLKGVTVSGVGLALAACVAQPAPSTTSGDAPAQEVVTLRFMERPHSVKARETYPDLIRENFTEQLDTPIAVEVEFPAQGWQEKLVTSMIAGDSVDIFQAWPDIFYVFVAKGLILDIQPFVDRDLTDADIDDFLDAQWNRLLIRGIRVGMPKYVDVRCIAYNMDIMDEYGVEYPANHGVDWDWQEFTDMAIALTQDVDGDGQTDIWGAKLSAGSPAELFGWLRAFGGDYVNPDDTRDCWLDEPGSQEALNWLYQNMWVTEPNPFARPEQASETNPDFVAGRVAMTWYWVRPAEQAEQLADQIRWDYAHVPSGPVRRDALGDADAWSIWEGSSHPDEAWQLINFLSGPLFQEIGTLRSEGTIPVRKSLLDVALEVYRDEFPSIANTYLEIIPEMFEMNYLENVNWFEDNALAMELIDPAMDRIFSLGEADPSYLVEICAQVEEQQTNL